MISYYYIKLWWLRYWKEIDNSYLKLDKKQKQFLYDISFSGNIEKIINKYDELNKVYRLRGYKNNISYIEIEAIKFIREKEKEYEKTRKIKKRW